MGSQCAKGFLSSWLGARFFGAKEVPPCLFPFFAARGSSDMRTRKRLPFAARFTSGKMIPSPVDL
jgi:hypothetical protein